MVLEKLSKNVAIILVALRFATTVRLVGGLNLTTKAAALVDKAATAAQAAAAAAAIPQKKPMPRANVVKKANRKEANPKGPRVSESARE